MSEELSEELRGVNEDERAHVIEGIEALDDQKRYLQGVNHGKGMGASEFIHIALQHPELTDFFDDAPKILNLSPEQDAVFMRLTNEYLAGSILPERLDTLKRKFFIPYMRSQRKEKAQ